jgi:hypothetical protein
MYRMSEDNLFSCAKNLAKLHKTSRTGSRDCSRKQDFQGKENEEFIDSMGTKCRRVVNMKNGKQKDKWAKFQPQ